MDTTTMRWMDPVLVDEEDDPLKKLIVFAKYPWQTGIVDIWICVCAAIYNTTLSNQPTHVHISP